MEPLPGRLLPSTCISLVAPSSCRSRRIWISSLCPLAVQEMEYAFPLQALSFGL